MKQLILYFLFFVCAAFVLIQCARYFPTDNGLKKENLRGGKINNHVSTKIAEAQLPYSHSSRSIGQALKKPGFNLYFTEQAFPLNMMKYINHYQFLSYQYWSINESKIDAWQLFYNPYTNFTYTGLFSKRDSGLMANNPFDQKS